jgi:hypothetical protein
MSALLFLPAFGLAGVGGRQRLRSGLLTAFGASHALHLAGIVAYASLLWPEFAREFPPVVLLVASIFFAAVFYAAGNGFLNVLRRRPLGPNWAAATSEYLVFTVFALDFGGKIVHQSLIYAPFLVLAVAAIGMRLTRRKTQALASGAAAGD